MRPKSEALAGEMLGPCENCGGDDERCQDCELCFLAIAAEEGSRKSETRCREKYDLLAKLYKMPSFALFYALYPGAGKSGIMPLMRPSAGMP